MPPAHGATAMRVGPTLPDLLAPHFHVHLPAGLFRTGCPGSDPGFFPRDSGRHASAISRSGAGTFPFLIDQVAEEFPDRCRRETPDPEARGRSEICFVGKMDGRSTLPVVDFRTDAGPSPADALFDLSWAAAVAEEALRRLRMECESKGRRRVFEVLQSYLTTERSDICYQDLSPHARSS